MKSGVVVATILISAFAAGFFLPRRHAAANIGYADTRALAAEDPGFGASADFANLNGALEGGISQKTMPPDRLAARLAGMESANSAAASKKMAFVWSGLERGMSGTLRLTLEAETAKLNDWLEKKRLDALAELDSLASPPAETDTPFSLQMRYRLMNLKLQLKALSRDEISFPKARVDEIEKKLERLEKQEADRRDGLARERMESYEAEATALNGEIENQYRQKREALENELDRSLETLEAEALGKLENIRLETKKTDEKGIAVKRAISRLLRSAATAAHSPPAIAPSKARREYLLAKLELKAAGVCPAHGIDLLLAKPVWAAAKITDYTALLSDAGGKRKRTTDDTKPRKH